VEVVAGLTLKNLRPRVWDRDGPEWVRGLSAVMLSFDEFRQRPILLQKAAREGLGAILANRGAELRMFLDNGAFACLRRGDTPAID